MVAQRYLNIRQEDPSQMRILGYALLRIDYNAIELGEDLVSVERYREIFLVELFCHEDRPRGGNSRRRSERRSDHPRSKSDQC
jgi:hypothetical protein